MFLTKNTMVAALAAVTLLLPAAAQELQEPAEAATQRILVVVDGTHRYDLDPHTASYTSESQVLTALYEGLFSYDPATLEPVNALCASYKVSRDKKRWTFTLREDATFSDGTPITAQTFRDSWISLLATPYAPFASLIDCISGARDFRTGGATEQDVRITVRDEQTLVVHLDEPTEHLPRILCHHAFSAVSDRPGVYSGPFVLRSYKDGMVQLMKNYNYRDADAVQVPGILIVQSDDADENAYLFNTGTVDWITGNATLADILNPDAVHVSAEFGTSYLFFKMGNEPWNTTEFRKALLEAVPYDKLRQNYAVPASTLVYPLMGYPTVSGLEDYDMEDAVLLMNRAREKAGIPLGQKIPIVFAIAESDYMREWALVLSDAWDPLGVSLFIQSTPADRYVDSIPGWSADLFSYSWIGDFADPLAFLELFRGGSSLNVADYENEAFDELLRQAASTESSGDRLKMLARAEQLLLDDGMVIPVSRPISLHIIDLQGVGGWQTNALDLHPFKYLYVKPQERRHPNLVSYPLP